MKIPLGTEVDFSPGHTVLDGDPAPPAKGAQELPLFGPCLLWPRSPISATAELMSIFKSLFYIELLRIKNAIGYCWYVARYFILVKTTDKLVN